MRRLPSSGCFVVLIMVLGACQQAAPIGRSEPATPEQPVTPIVREKAADDVNWRLARDCLGQLALLRKGLSDGRIIDLDKTPFDLVDEVVGAVAYGPAFAGMVDADASFSDKRCIIRVGQAVDRHSEHRVLGQEHVRSRYQSGTRSEKNPAYEVAKARVRQAEKAAKPGKSSLIKVGDPLIDLVGTLVGGALTGIGQWGTGDQLEDALNTLMATPPSIEHPKYQSYRFERVRLRAGRQATLPIILTDRRLQQSWETRIRRREVQNLSLIRGLDPQDEHYARHRKESVTEEGLEQWLATPPVLPLEDLVVALIDRHQTAPLDRLALGETTKGEPISDPVADDLSLDAALAPDRSPASHQMVPSGIDRESRATTSKESHVTVQSEDGDIGAIYIASHFILSPSHAISGRGLVDVGNRAGGSTLGLVAAIDQRLGLALIQVPTPGRPVTISRRQAGTIANGDPRSLAQGIRRSKGGPIIANGRLIGFRTSRGPDIGLDAIHAFLDQQRKLLPADQVLLEETQGR